MSRADMVRLAGFVLPAGAALGVFAYTDSWWWFLAALVGVLLIGVPVDYLYRRFATPEELRRDLEDRVRNPPS